MRRTRVEYAGELSEQELDTIFETELAPRLFEGISRPIESTPRAVLIGGQPGSGKSARERQIIEELNNKESNTALEINGDDFRGFHPYYFELLEQDDSTAAAKIDKDNAGLIRRAIDASLNVGAHVLIEGTFRRDQVVAETAAKYKEHGYDTQAVLLAVHPLLSRLGILQRYALQKGLSPYARFTVRSAHDAAVDGIPISITRIISTEAVDGLMIMQRNNNVLFSEELRGSTIEQKQAYTQDALKAIQAAFTNISLADKAAAQDQLDMLAYRLHQSDIPKDVRDEFDELRREVDEIVAVDSVMSDAE